MVIVKFSFWKRAINRLHLIHASLFSYIVKEKKFCFLKKIIHDKFLMDAVWAAQTNGCTKSWVQPRLHRVLIDYVGSRFSLLHWLTVILSYDPDEVTFRWCHHIFVYSVPAFLLSYK